MRSLAAHRLTVTVTLCSVLFSATISDRIPANVHDKPNKLQNDLPRIRTHGGVLYVEAGGSGNGTISFSAAAIKVGQDDLIQTIDAARKIPVLSHQLDLVLASLGMQNDTGDGGSSAGESVRFPINANLSQAAQETSKKLQRLQRRLNRLETRVQDTLTLLSRDECLASPCKNGATCIDKYNGFTCLCDRGWEGVVCDVDKNECALFNGTDLACQNGGSCVNMQGTYRCDCPPAWHGIHCTVQKDDCSGSSNQEICGHGTCITLARSTHNVSSYSCLCDAGWKKSAGENSPCDIDIDECTVSKPPCSTEPSVACINTPGSFRCAACPPGYDGNGIVCNDINECLTNNGGCSRDPLVSCINTIGSFFCSGCPYGYNGDGFTCTPYGNTCLTNNGGCSPNAVCTNNYFTNYAMCTCRYGYTGSGIGPNGCTLSSSVYSPIYNPYGVSATVCDSSPCQNGGICFENTSFVAQTYNAQNYYCECIPPWTGRNCDSYQTACGGQLAGSVGRFSTPSDPTADGEYDHNSHCTWTITANANEVIWLRFVHFQLEHHAQCRYDYVEIFDPAALSNTNGSLGRLCGKDVPQSFTSAGNKLIVEFHSDASVHYGGFTALYTTMEASKVCGGELRQSSGTIRSPNFPSEYPAMSSCTWTIAADEGHQIVLNITDFNLEQQEDCHADYVEIRNGGSESSPLIRRLCGSHEPLQIKSHFNRLFLRFVSDRFRHGTGFSANYFTTATGCNGIMRAPFGAITSPNYPSPYAHNTECYWHIHAASGSFIQATFVDFDLENSIGCKYDYVSIFDGPTSHFPPLDTLCGTINPQKSIPTTSNEMLIKFRSDLSSHGRGFHLTYQSICQRRILKQRSGVIESPGFPENYPSNSRCDYQIQVPRGNKINITFSHFGMPEGGTCLSDYLSVYDGDSNSSRRIGMYCGSTPPLPFQSTGNQVFIEFVSDSTTSGSGFRLEWTTWGCGGDILVDRRDNAVARYITSPKYPSPYPPNTVCEWKLISSEYGYGIKLDLMDIDLEQHPTCRWDKLEVFNGPDDKSQPITTLCHTQNVSKTLSSTGQYLFVRFNSDQSKAGNGFKLQYSVVPSICGGNFSIPKSSIQSSQYPQQYEKNLTCGWLITVAEQHVVVLNITALDTDMDPSCESEYLAAYDGDSTSGETLLKECGPQRVTGSTAGGGMVVRSTSNQMFLEFRSNDVQDHNAIGFRAEYTTGCGAVLIASDTPEVFISPNFPSRYAKSLNCSYIIQSEEPNTKVFLQFSFMDIEERNNCTTADYLQIRNGNNPDAPLIGNYCGRKIPPAIISSGNALYIRFTSNDWKEEAGWSATYSNTLSSCGGELRALEGHFVSPNYPSNYVNNAECVWVIKASPGNTIDLNFQNFNLGNKAEDPYCNSDYVEVREESASGIVLGRFCGADVPDNMTSGVGTLWVMFRSSDSDTHPGFLAEYKLRHGGEITGKTSGQIASPLYPMNYPHNASFTWRVTTISGFTIKVKWLRMDMEDRRCYFDYLALYNGPSPVYPLIGKYCGYEIPEPIQTTSNQLFIVMNTDRYGGNGQGFLMEWEAVAPLSAADRTTSVGANQFTFDLKATKNVQKIISPGYPINVMPNQTYDWKLRTDETSHIELTIHDMNFGRRNDSFCSTDKPWLQVVEGTSYRNGKTITNLCNITDKPRYFKATTNNMRLTFLAGPNPDPAATGFNASFQAVCGASIQGSSGQITSENFRTSDVAVVDQNGMNIECVWNVSTDFGQTFEITFDEFELTPSPNCSQHSLTILNGFVGESSVLSPPIGRFCGSTLPRTVPQTRSNRFQVRYYKDPSVTVPTRGFSLKYRLTRYPCGGELRLTDFDRTGIFTTPNFPENYPTNIECEWIIVAPGGDRIRLDFIEKFEMERPNNNACPWDYVEVRDGATTDAALIGHYCGTNRPGTLRSRSNVMYVKFRSDRGLVHSGFKANYSISTCGGTIVDSSGSITNPSYPQSYPVSGSFDCEWYIQVPVGHFINFEVRDFKLPIWSLNCTFGDFVEFREYNATGKVIKRLCGTQAAMTFSSSDSLVYVRFKTSTSPPQPTGGLTPETANKFRVLFVANTESCGGTLTTSSGIITSPGFPNAYPNNRVCVWKIIATPGRRVLLEVLDFDVEGYGFCQSDFVEVYNGILPDSPRIERLCGSRQAISTKISSSMHYMTVRFQTDSSRTSRGFRLRYSSLEAAKCGGALTSLSGVISSPNFNSSVKFGGYEANEECIWTINNLTIAGDPSTINLELTHLDMETLTSPMTTTPSDDCRSDFVEVRAGKESTDPLVQTVCGRRSDYTEESLMIPGQTAWIRFRSDYSHQLSGFRIVYNISNCGGVVNQLAGWILSPGYSDYASTEYPPNLNCAWLIQTPTGGGQIQFTLRDLQLESSLNCSKDSLEILNGRYHTSPKIGETLCGTQAISPIRSQGSSMYVKFRSDSAGSARGFKASYMTVTNGCGGTYHGNTGYIATPGFIDNDNYPENMECVWDIIVDIGYHINFTFSGRFDIQKSDDCNDDYVELSDRAADPRNPQILGRYCGHDTPNATLSSSNRMRIRFRSNAAATAKGFNATWTIGCGGRLTDGEGTIVSPGFPGKPDNNLMCRWEIVANPATPNIKLEFDPDHFDIEGSRRLMLKEAGRANLMGYQLEVMCHDYLIVYGERTDNESQAISNPPRLCGSGSTDIPQPIYAQNKMTIFFATDFALAGNGFKLTYKTQTAPFYADAQRVTPSVVPVGRLFRWSGG